MTFKQPTGPIKINRNALKLADETSAILHTAQAYAEADVAVAPGSLTFNVLAQKDAFARVGVTSNESGGYYLILKKVNAVWVTLLGGQDLPGKDIGAKYGMPEGWYSTEY